MCKLLRMSLLCLLFLFTFCISCSFASITYTKFTEYNYNGTYSDLSEDLFTLCFNQSYNEYLNNISRTTDISNFNSFLTDLNSNNFTNFYLYVSYSSTNASFGSNYNVLGFYFGNNNFTGNVHKYGFNVSSSLDYRCSYSTSSGQSVNGNSVNSYLYNGEKWYISNGSNYQPIVNNLIKFVPYSDDTILVNFNGGSLTARKLFINSTIQTTKLGNLTNLSSITGTNQIKATLGYPIDSTGSLYNWADFISYYSPYFDSTYTKGSLYINYNGEVTINANYLVPNQSYVLRFDIVDSNGNTISSDILDSSTQSIEFYTLPYGSSDTSGDLISPDLDINTIPNQSLINAIDLLNQQDKENLPYMLNGIFSGDLFSGDFMGINYTGIDEDNQYYGLIYSIFNNLMDLLQDNTTNSSVNISVHGYTRTLYASDFTIGNNFFTSFCRLFLIAGTIILLYQQVVAIYISALTLDLSTVLKSADVDYTFFM